MKKNLFFLFLSLIFGMINCSSAPKETKSGTDPKSIKPLFFFHAGNSACSPAENVKGKNFRPEEVMSDFPECNFAPWPKVPGTYILDCKASRLKTSFFYADTKEKCDKFASEYNPGN